MGKCVTYTVTIAMIYSLYLVLKYFGDPYGLIDEFGFVAMGKSNHADFWTSSNDEYFLLALKRCDAESSWTLHGLWPQFTEHKWPQWCNRSDVLENETVRHFPELYRMWPSCDGDNVKFWEHEWLKHGTCSGMSQLKYFETALSLLVNFKDSCWNYRRVKHPSFYQECRIPVLLPEKF